MKKELLEIQNLIQYARSELIDEMKRGDRQYYPDDDGLDTIDDPSDCVIDALNMSGLILKDLLESKNEKDE